MKFTKTNVRRGTTATAAGGNAGSGSTTAAAVDLSSVITAIDGNAGDIESLRNEVAQLRQQLASITAAMLRKDDDDSNNGHTLRLGAVVTDTLMSNVYDNGRGAMLGLGGDAAAPEWLMVLRNVADRVDKTAPMADTIGEGVTYDTSVASATQTLASTAAVTVSNSTAGAMLRVKAGITAGNGVTLLEQHLHYSVGQVISGRSKQASTPPHDIIADNPEAVNIGGDVWQLPLEDANTFGDTFVYSFVYQATYRVEVGSVSQVVRLYIKGTQGDGTTRYFGGAACQLLAYADRLQLTADGAGIVVRPAGIYRRAADGTETQLL